MGQEQEKLNALLAFIEELYKNPDNKEFADRVNSMVLSNVSDASQGLEKMLSTIQDAISEVKEATSTTIDGLTELNDAQKRNIKLSGSSYLLSKEIYELCLSKILEKHAKGFYAGFPVESMVETLVKDFVKMEECKRHGDFEGFCRHMYLQIEYITNYFAKEFELQQIIYLMLDVSPYCDSDGSRLAVSDKEPTIIRNIIFSYPKEEDLKKKNHKCPGVYDFDITKLSAMEKFRTIRYFICHKGVLWRTQKHYWKEINADVSDLYNYRNRESHRGKEVEPWVQETYDKIDPQVDRYYMRFSKVFYEYVEAIRDGFPISKKLKEYALSFQVKEVPFKVTHADSNSVILNCDGKLENLSSQQRKQYSEKLIQDAVGTALMKGGKIIELKFPE